MSMQFNCPFCQLLMSAAPGFAGGQVQCPSCHQLFVVGAPAPVVPVVQARHVPGPQAPAPVQQPQPTQPQAPRAPTPGAPQARRAPGSSTSRTAPQPQKGGGMVALAVVGLVLLTGGLIYGGVRLIGGMQKKAEVSQFDLPPEVKAREAAQRAQLAKEKAEQDAEESKRYGASIEALMQILGCQRNIATEIQKEYMGIKDELKELRSDADPDNDPKDLLDFFTKRLSDRLDKNNSVHHWLGGRPSKSVAVALWGDGQKEKGQVAGFLRDGGYNSSGTGFFISADGWIITNHHVVDDAKDVDIRWPDGEIRHAKVVKTSKDDDIALLKADDAPKSWLHLIDSEAPMGADVCTVGFPRADIQGVEPKYTTGTVSSLTGYRDDKDSYQITVPIQPGNSGGPLVDMKSGEVVGVVNAVLNHERGAENVSYAIKGSVAAKLIGSVPEAAAACKQAASAPAPKDGVALAANVRQGIVMVLVK